MTLVVNIFGGPGAGKSTFAAALFMRLKRLHVESELVSEVAKQRIWEGRGHALRNQITMLGDQWELVETLLGKVDVVVTDSPVLLCSIYAPTEYPQVFHELALWCHRSVDSLNVVLDRHRSGYQTSGRMQSLEEALEKDHAIRQLLAGKDIPTLDVSNDDGGLDTAVETVLRQIGPRARAAGGEDLIIRPTVPLDAPSLPWPGRETLRLATDYACDALVGFIAEAGGRMVGHVALCPDTGHIEALEVTGETGRGIGSALLGAIENAARAMAIRTLSAPDQPFFRNRGYAPDLTGLLVKELEL
jgi:hypothetical protein